jgi:hypothetical protein
VVSRSLVPDRGALRVRASAPATTRTIHFVPGAKQNGSSYTMPYGRWDATRWWAPNGYRTSGDGSLDFALIEIAPQNGRYIGDVVGAILDQLRPERVRQRRTYLVGYPSSAGSAPTTTQRLLAVRLRLDL